MKRYLIVLIASLFSLSLFPQKPELFPSLDGLMIHATLYEASGKSNGIILLCHQARYSKGEYIETAQKLNKLGYTCLAIDQRSGNEINGIVNETAKQATEQGLPTTYTDAEQDIKAALYFLYEKYQRKIILLGSSYSAALALKIGGEEKDKLERIIAFSPGEYFETKGIVNGWNKKIDLPVLITCAKNEIAYTTPLMDGVDNKKLVYFKPKKDGIHGSSALWSSTPNNSEYWNALNDFLKH